MSGKSFELIVFRRRAVVMRRFWRSLGLGSFWVWIRSVRRFSRSEICVMKRMRGGSFVDLAKSMRKTGMPSKSNTRPPQKSATLVLRVPVVALSMMGRIFVILFSRADLRFSRTVSASSLRKVFWKEARSDWIIS